MSILTKVLIVLLSFSSLFLCGAVVTYVGSASNYKQKYEDQRQIVAAIEAEKATLQRIAEEKDSLIKMQISEHQENIAALQQENTTLTAALKKAELDSLMHQARADKWQGILESYGLTIGNMDKTLKNTQAQLDLLREESIKNKKELNQTYAKVYDTTVQMQRLEAQKRRAEERAKALEDQMSGDAAVAPVGVVTMEKSVVTPAIPASAGAVDLKGLISGVHKDMASLSIGSADGVKKDMVFHVTRGDEFICDIVITDVDMNKSVGSLELVLQQPKIGDNVSTSM